MSEQQLLFGFGETNITPSEPVQLAGYYYERITTAVHDPLLARSMAVSDGENRAVLCVADVVHLTREIVAQTRQLVAEQTDLAPDCLMLSVIHTHTGPAVGKEPEYAATLPELLAESVRLALEDISPGNASVASGEAGAFQFIRRYRMKDGSVRTNPGVLNPNVVAPIGEPDPEVLTLLVSKSGKTCGGFVNFGLHCDTVGGTEISADWTCFLRQKLCATLKEEPTLLTPIACCGDVNHWNVFEEVTSRGFEETERIGTGVAAAAIESLPSLAPIASGRVCGLSEEITAQTRMPSDTELEAAKKILEAPPAEGVDFEIGRVEAFRKVRVAKIGPEMTLRIDVITLGDVALVSVPCELFSALGRDIKARSPFAHTAIVTLGDANIGYVGERQNYEEGGYETTSSLVAPGTGELTADTAVNMLERAYRSKEESL